jgi:hypothetical protein
MVTRRVFETWSIDTPASLEETFIAEDGYWHAYGPDRSISLTSIVLTDGDRPVPAGEIVKVLPRPKGTPVSELPDGLPGWAVLGKAPPSARASRILQGMLASRGRVLLATITADDPAWAKTIWLSIRCHAPRVN